MNDAIFKLIIINAMRASHKKNVDEKYYKQQDSFYDNEHVSGTIEDLLELQKEEDKILDAEDRWMEKYSKLEIPEFISVKQYAETVGCSIWKVYREIKKGAILARKVKNRWRIYLSIDAMEEVA